MQEAGKTLVAEQPQRELRQKGRRAPMQERVERRQKPRWNGQRVARRRPGAHEARWEEKTLGRLTLACDEQQAQESSERVARAAAPLEHAEAPPARVAAV